VGTFKRDYLGDADLRDAETVLAQLGRQFDDYNSQAPHSALGMRSPREYRALTLTAAFGTATASTATPHLPQDARSSRGPLSGTPRKSGWRRRVRAANLSSPPEQKIGEHSSVPCGRWSRTNSSRSVSRVMGADLALSRLPHHAQDVVDAEPGVLPSGKSTVAYF